jgi:hypothetical protein
MSLFEFRKAPASETKADALEKLRATLNRLNADPEDTPGITDLKNILAARIAEMERKTA